MPERLRAFLDRPLDPRAGLAVLLLASAILLGFAALFVLGASGSAGRVTKREVAPRRSAVSVPPLREAASGMPRRAAPRVSRQDPQDERGAAAARRASRTLRSHRALQHLPVREGGLSIRLVGARGGRAVLCVSALRLGAARRGWRAFLRRYGDSGRSYIPVFAAERRAGGGA